MAGTDSVWNGESVVLVRELPNWFVIVPFFCGIIGHLLILLTVCFACFNDSKSNYVVCYCIWWLEIRMCSEMYLVGVESCMPCFWEGLWFPVCGPSLNEIWFLLCNLIIFPNLYKISYKRKYRPKTFCIFIMFLKEVFCSARLFKNGNIVTHYYNLK